MPFIDMLVSLKRFQLFQPPVEFEKWEGVRDALIQPPVCLQADPMWNQVFGQEDCLYLNVFTPNVSN